MQASSLATALWRARSLAACSFQGQNWTLGLSSGRPAALRNPDQLRVRAPSSPGLVVTFLTSASGDLSIEFQQQQQSSHGPGRLGRDKRGGWPRPNLNPPLGSEDFIDRQTSCDTPARNKLWRMLSKCYLLAARFAPAAGNSDKLLANRVRKGSAMMRSAHGTRTSSMAERPGRITQVPEWG